MTEAQQISARIRVLRLAAVAFGILQKEFTDDRMRLWRSAEGQTRGLEELKQVEAALNNAILGRTRVWDRAGGGGANEFTDRMLQHSLRLYPDACAKIRVGASLGPTELRLFITEVLVPTAFAEMCTTRSSVADHPLVGLGREFDGPSSWYAPEDGKVFRALLDRWLRVMGYRTPCGFSRDSDQLKDEVKRWWKGGLLPRCERLDRLVMAKKYADRVAWLDDAQNWKARLRLARALQFLGKQASEYFGDQGGEPVPSLHEQFTAINAEEVATDPEGWLSDPRIFWAVRLVQRHLKLSGRWDAVTQGSRRGMRRKFSRRVSDAQIEVHRRAEMRNLSPGYRLIQHLAREGGITLGDDFYDSIKSREKVEQLVLNFGFVELCRLAKEERPAVSAGRSG